MDIQELIIWTFEAAVGFFLYFNLVEIAAESFAKWFVHKLNMSIKKEKAAEQRAEELDEIEYRKWLHADPLWIGE